MDAAAAAHLQVNADEWYKDVCNMLERRDMPSADAAMRVSPDLTATYANELLVHTAATGSASPALINRLLVTHRAAPFYNNYAALREATKAAAEAATAVSLVVRELVCALVQDAAANNACRRDSHVAALHRELRLALDDHNVPLAHELAVLLPPPPPPAAAAVVVVAEPRRKRQRLVVAEEEEEDEETLAAPVAPLIDPGVLAAVRTRYVVAANEHYRMPAVFVHRFIARTLVAAGRATTDAVCAAYMRRAFGVRALAGAHSARGTYSGVRLRRDAAVVQ